MGVESGLYLQLTMIHLALALSISVLYHPINETREMQGLIQLDHMVVYCTIQTKQGSFNI